MPRNNSLLQNGLHPVIAVRQLQGLSGFAEQNSMWRGK